MAKEILSKTILVRNKNPDAWFGVFYNMNIYRGCRHGCIYCDSRSLCYGIESFEELAVKVNAVDLLRVELASKRKKGTIGTGAMSDPYNPAEQDYGLTRRALEIIVEYGFPVHVSTKSDLILRDTDLLLEAKKVFASAAFTITTCDDGLAAKIEPRAPRPAERLRAMKKLAESGIYTGVLMMPVLPFIEDTEENISEIIEKARENGASFIIPWMGMSLRDRQRDYYYKSLDGLFPGLSDKYRRVYGNTYNCLSPDSGKLNRLFNQTCRSYGLACDMKEVKKYERQESPVQLSLFDCN